MASRVPGVKLGKVGTRVTYAGKVWTVWSKAPGVGQVWLVDDEQKSIQVSTRELSPARVRMPRATS